MQVTVKLFALMREQAGTDTVELTVPEGTTLRQVLDVLCQRHPVLAPSLANTRLSVHMEFVDTETVLQPGDEVALIPPVSGGK